MTPVRRWLAVAAVVAVPTLAAVDAVDFRDPQLITKSEAEAEFEVSAPPATADVPVTGLQRIAVPAVAAPAAVAQRAGTTATIVAPATTVDVGLWGRPFAPDGLDDCGTALFYREQWGLPAEFDRLAFRESRCIQAEHVRTSCCVGRWQLYVRLHVRNDVLRLRYEECGVFTEWDVDGPEPLEQQRAACATRALWDVAGMQPWRLS